MGKYWIIRVRRGDLSWYICKIGSLWGLRDYILDATMFPTYSQANQFVRDKVNSSFDHMVICYDVDTGKLLSVDEQRIQIALESHNEKLRSGGNAIT